ncbi:MAG: hypothetical protein IJ400_07520 [Clostridia bacterium]|nr:hypothetical protein [Clostridia bacterium]
MKKNFTELFYKNVHYITVVLISLIYIGGSMIMISKTGRSVSEIVGTGLLSMIVGFLINGIFRQIGVQRGDEDEKMQATTRLHSQTVEKAMPYIDKLDSFCQRENASTRKRLRGGILLEAGMDYKSYFDDEGKQICHEYRLYSKEDVKSAGFFGGMSLKRKNHQRKKALDKAVTLKLNQLTPQALTSWGGKSENPFDFGKSKTKYTRGQNATDLVLRLLLAIVFGYFGVSLVGEINVASIIWNTLQIVMYLCGGVIQMYSAYVWVTDTYRGTIMQKIDLLERFLHTL